MITDFTGEWSLYEIVRTYLEACGWYWDEEHSASGSDPRPLGISTTTTAGRSRSGARTGRSAPTSEPRRGVDTRASRTRRYESFEDATRSQMLRELEPETYEEFYL